MGRKILLIDDSAMLRRIAANILHAQPGRYDVVASSRAAEGFALACVGGVDLILMDYLIAGAGDAHLCRRLLADARTARVPTVLMVGHGIRPPALSTLPLNVVDTLSKPFAPEQLSGVVNNLFERTRTELTLLELRQCLHRDIPLEPSLSEQQTFFDPEPIIPAGSTSHLDGDSRVARAIDSKPVLERASLTKGDTATVPLRHVTQSIAQASKTGVLRLWLEHGEPTDVIFDQGKIVVVSTRDGKSYAEGAREILPTKVSPATLEEAVTEQTANGIPFLLTLGTRGLLSKSSAVSYLHRFGQRQFARFWPQRVRPPVRFEFTPLDALPQFALRLEAPQKPVDTWLLESTRCLRAEDLNANWRHEGLVGTPFFQPDGEAILGNLDLNEGERALAGLVRGRIDLPNLAMRLGITQEAVYQTVYRFRCLDAMGYRTAPAAFVMTPRSRPRRVLPLLR